MLGLALPAFAGSFGIDVLRKVTLKMRVEADAVWRSEVGELDRPIRGLDLFEPEVVRVRAAGADNR